MRMSSSVRFIGDSPFTRIAARRIERRNAHAHRPLTSVDLPQPDSPAMPRISPCFIENENIRHRVDLFAETRHNED